MAATVEYTGMNSHTPRVMHPGALSCFSETIGAVALSTGLYS